MIYQHKHIKYKEKGKWFINTIILKFINTSKKIKHHLQFFIDFGFSVELFLPSINIDLVEPTVILYFIKLIQYWHDDICWLTFKSNLIPRNAGTSRQFFKLNKLKMFSHLEVVKLVEFSLSAVLSGHLSPSSNGILSCHVGSKTICKSIFWKSTLFLPRRRISLSWCCCSSVNRRVCKKSCFQALSVSQYSQEETICKQPGTRPSRWRRPSAGRWRTGRDPRQVCRPWAGQLVIPWNAWGPSLFFNCLLLSLVLWPQQQRVVISGKQRKVFIWY